MPRSTLYTGNESDNRRVGFLINAVTLDSALAVRELKEQGLTFKEIARQLDMPLSNVGQYSRWMRKELAFREKYGPPWCMFHWRIRNNLRRAGYTWDQEGLDRLREDITIRRFRPEWVWTGVSFTTYYRLCSFLGIEPPAQRLSPYLRILP